MRLKYGQVERPMMTTTTERKITQSNKNENYEWHCERNVNLMEGITYAHTLDHTTGPDRQPNGRQLANTFLTPDINFKLFN